MPTERNERMWQQLIVTACGENICVKIKTNIHWMHSLQKRMQNKSKYKIICCNINGNRNSWHGKKEWTKKHDFGYDDDDGSAVAATATPVSHQTDAKNRRVEPKKCRLFVFFHIDTLLLLNVTIATAVVSTKRTTKKRLHVENNYIEATEIAV